MPGEPCRAPLDVCRRQRPQRSRDIAEPKVSEMTLLEVVQPISKTRIDGHAQTLPVFAGKLSTFNFQLNCQLKL
jgi:hypothetical protein